MRAEPHPLLPDLSNALAQWRRRGRLADLLAPLLSWCLARFGAERGLLFTEVPDGGYRVWGSRDADGDTIPAAERSIAHFAVMRAAGSAAPTLFSDTRADRRFRTEAERESGARSRSILIAPVLRDEPVAALYLDSRFRVIDEPAEDDVEWRVVLDLLAAGLAAESERSVRRQLERSVRSRSPKAPPEPSSAALPSRGTRMTPARTLAEPVEFHGFLTRSAEFAETLAEVRILSASTVPVLIEGESGTGKELLARAIHAESRREGAFVTLHCGTVPESLVEVELFGHREGAFTGADRDRPGLLAHARGGTLFLDAIEEASPTLQAALLRVLEDLDDDGVPDLAVANRSEVYDDVSVLLGLGDGTFAAARDFTAGAGARSIASGDLNRDGVADLAVANARSDNVSVLLGLGDGTFAPAQGFAAGDAPHSVTIADLDGDGVPDLAVANALSDEVSVLMGLGDGTFAAAQSLFMGDLPEHVAIADLDGDGAPDLTTANFYSDDVSVLHGLGDGTFPVPLRYRVGFDPRSLVAEDLDRDGVPDLATANRWSHSVSVLRGLGDGLFAPAQSVPTGNGPGSLEVEDLNGDGAPDLITANYYDVSVLLGLGDGTFAPAQSPPTGVETGSMAIADLDGDAVPDLAVVNTDFRTVFLFPGIGDGTFAETLRISVHVRRPRSVAAHDLDGDGVPDLVVTHSFYGSPISVLLNQLLK